MSKFNLKIPDIAAGKVIPPKIANAILQEEKEQQIRNETLHKDEERYKKDVRRSWIQFWVPVVISIFSLIGAYRQELVWLLQEIMKLMK